MLKSTQKQSFGWIIIEMKGKLSELSDRQTDSQPDRLTDRQTNWERQADRIWIAAVSSQKYSPCRFVILYRKMNLTRRCWNRLEMVTVNRIPPVLGFSR